MRKIVVALLLAVLAGPAWTQSLEQPTAKQRAAQTYAAHAWPAAGPERAGLDPASLLATGFQLNQLRIDPRSGVATVSYLTLGKDGKPTARAHTALVTVQVHATSAAARDVLLAQLSAVQVKLVREEGLGEVAFGNRAGGRLVYAVGAVGNVTYVARALAKVDVQPLAAAATRQANAAPAIERGQAVAPKILACEVAPAQVDRPTQVALDFDPGAPKAAHVAFECTNGASVLATRSGYELYASKPGMVTIRVSACSKGLRVGTFTATVEVAPASDR